LSYPDLGEYRVGIKYAALLVMDSRDPLSADQGAAELHYDVKNDSSVHCASDNVAANLEEAVIIEASAKLVGDGEACGLSIVSEEQPQAKSLYQQMSADQKTLLIGNLVTALNTALLRVQTGLLGQSEEAESNCGVPLS
jgi:catalase